ncbi:MAG: NAD(+) diphosphatase [Oscillospiraceae bacterium]|nr:NAD(+) diphosphatase [Oscillospiraceae bacterium]
MFQDLGDIRYDNAFRRLSPEPESLALLRRGDGLLAGTADGTLRLPRFGELPKALRALPCRYAFSLGGEACFLLDGDSLAQAPSLPGLALLSSRDYRSAEPKEALFAAAVSESLQRWYRANRFCGRCGRVMQDSETERALVCPDCGLTVYPKISPAVIVAVTDGDRLLLTKYRGRAFKRYALVAGFHEIGENIEDTVRREVFEETGLRVKALRYYKSQPWVFTDSLLLGFYCQLEGSDRIKLQEDELSVAEWFRREEIPDDFNPISLTGEMIERFRRGMPLPAPVLEDRP